MIYNIDKYKNKIAIIENEKLYTFSDLILQIHNFSDKIISNEIKNSEIVVLLGDYSFTSISLFISLHLNKNIIIPITSKNTIEINEKIKQSSADWIWDIDNNSITKSHENNQEQHDLVKKLKVENSSGLILFSSGSTGIPKSMLHNLDNLIKSHSEKKSKDLVFLIFLMFDHIGGINTMLNCLSTGSTMVIPQNRKPEDICRLIEKYKINILPSSPTFLNLILISGAYLKYDLKSVKLITYGTEPMPDSLLIKLKEIFNRVKFLQTFGTSETGIVKTTSLSSTSTFLKFDDPNQEYKVVNNELWLRSKTQILGYMNYDNTSFTEDGWFKTGDTVEVIDDDFIKIIGRIKEVINVGGEKVLPEEVESVIMELPEVNDCLVFGLKNSITGFMVAVKIQAKNDVDLNQLRSNIKKYCQKKLESYKVPVKISFVEEIKYTNRFKKVRDLK
jgi:acyl-CoA synthetase (AMP-forming)/AMP-acid ligase II